MHLTWLTDTVTPDLDRALRYTLLWGLEGVVLRRVGKGASTVPHVNEEKVARRLREHDLPLDAIVPGLFEGEATDRAGWFNEIAQLPEVLRFCERVGCAQIVTSAFVADEAGDAEQHGAAREALRRGGEVATRTGCRLLVRNEAGSLAPTAQALAQLIEGMGAGVAAAWDPVGAYRAGEAPEAGLRALLEAGIPIALVFASDGEGDASGRWETSVVGEGSVPWRAILAGLHSSGFAGAVCLEVDVHPAPKMGLRSASALAAMIRAARKAA